MTLNPLSIKDLLIKIGKMKQEMEKADDMKKMCSHEIFHDILSFLWLGITGCVLEYRSKQLKEDRLRINRCYFSIHFNLYHKHKKKPYYTAHIPVTNYTNVAEQMLNCKPLMHFFKHLDSINIIAKNF